jgi:tetratricopeptide (TPR) repeat protein
VPPQYSSTDEVPDWPQIADISTLTTKRASHSKNGRRLFRRVIPRILSAFNWERCAGSLASAQQNLRSCSARRLFFWVSCAAEKHDRPMAARDLYCSDLFEKSRDFVQRQRGRWFILSAKYGLVAPEEVIEPYNETLKDKTADQRYCWATAVVEKLKAHCPRGTTVVFWQASGTENSCACSSRARHQRGSSHGRAEDRRAAKLAGKSLKDIDESSWAFVLQEAERARTLVADVATRSEGMRLFDQLAREYPRDGMVYFKRGEALEAQNEREKASTDFRKAEEHFKKELWRNLARMRYEHLDEQVRSTRIGERVRVALGARALELTFVEQSAWLAGTSTERGPFVSLELSRTALVRAIIALEDGSEAKSSRGSRPPWRERLSRFSQRVSSESLEKARRLLLKRDNAVYRGEHVSQADAEEAFETVLSFVREAVRRRKR